jgi:hypothetical protein
MGKILIRSFLNYTAVYRYFNKLGWQIRDSVFDKNPDDLKTTGKALEYLCILQKGFCNIPLTPVMTSRLYFEFLTLSSLAEILDSVAKERPVLSSEARCLVNYVADKTNWQ